MCVMGAFAFLKSKMATKSCGIARFFLGEWFNFFPSFLFGDDSDSSAFSPVYETFCESITLLISQQVDYPRGKETLQANTKIDQIGHLSDSLYFLEITQLKSAKYLSTEIQK